MAEGFGDRAVGIQAVGSAAHSGERLEEASSHRQASGNRGLGLVVEGEEWGRGWGGPWTGACW